MVTAPFYVGPNLPIRPNADPVDCIKRLKCLGFRYLGSGMCAYAYGRGQRVVKIVCGDSGHRAAVDLFAAYPEVDAFPIIYGLVDLGEDCFAYETELLEQGFGSEGFEAQSARSYLDALDADEEPEFYHYGAEVFIETFDRDTLELVLDGCPPEVSFIDLHSGNVMARSDGSPVIVDPYHSWTSDPVALQRVNATHHGSFERA